MPGGDEPPLVVDPGKKPEPEQPGKELSPWQFGKELQEPPVLVNYAWLEKAGIFSNRMDCARKRKEGFPAPIEHSRNKIAWVWDEVHAWLAARPRRVAGDGPKIGAYKPEAAA